MKQKAGTQTGHRKNKEMAQQVRVLAAQTWTLCLSFNSDGESQSHRNDCPKGVSLLYSLTPRNRRQVSPCRTTQGSTRHLGGRQREEMEEPCCGFCGKNQVRVCRDNSWFSGTCPGDQRQAAVVVVWESCRRVGVRLWNITSLIAVCLVSKLRKGGSILAHSSRIQSVRRKEAF